MIYTCSQCGAAEVRLWRQSQTFADHVCLMCIHCACEDQRKSLADVLDAIRRSRSDQIGWMVPAVPAPGDTFWGYTSVPMARVRWWQSLRFQPRDTPPFLRHGRYEGECARIDSDSDRCTPVPDMELT